MKLYGRGTEHAAPSLRSEMCSNPAFYVFCKCYRVTVLVWARIVLSFCSNKEGVWLLGHRGFYLPPLRMGRKGLLQRRRLLQVEKMWGGEISSIIYCRVFSLWIISFLVPFVIIFFFPFTVHSFNSLLFPVNCSYLNPWIFFVLHLAGERGDDLPVALEGILNSGIPFLIHPNNKLQKTLGWWGNAKH